MEDEGEYPVMILNEGKPNEASDVDVDITNQQAKKQHELFV